MQKKAQFDDRIRNLIALAQDGTKHSRTLLFSHISDLFLQKRPMASATQVRMLTEILKELLSQVDLHVRHEVAAALGAMTNPPEELINIICEDVVEVSGILLEKAILPDDKLIHIIRYGSQAHRIHISRRFGLSPLVRRELEKANQESNNSKLKYSLNDLDKLAEDVVPELDEETTSNILELLRAQNINSPLHESDLPEQDRSPDTSDDTAQKEDRSDKLENIAILPTSPFTFYQKKPNDSSPVPPQSTPSNNEKKAQMAEDSPLAKPHIRPAETPYSSDGSFKDRSMSFQGDIPANDASQPSSIIQMRDVSVDITSDISQQTQNIRDETNRQREFVRTVANWFWEVDRTGAITFLSEEAFTVFGKPAQTLVGKDFISLCSLPEDLVAKSPELKTFEDLFEHRSSFRNKPFYIASPTGEKTLWYMSAISIFDIHSGRFLGFRGSARIEDSEAISLTVANSPSQTKPETDQGTDDQSGLNEDAVFEDLEIQKKGNEEVAAELLQNLSHEFRTPLNAIIGFSEMIDMETWGPVNEQYHQNTKNILAAAVQLKEAVNDVLDSAKLEAGLMQIEPESFSLKSLLKNCQNNVTSMAHDHKVQLVDDHNNIDVILYNDKQSVELCLTKMIASSIKNAAGGEVISPSVLINSNAQVRIEIPILGPRIDEKDADILFQRLKYESDNQVKSSGNALKHKPKISPGFGLSIAQKLARLIGGDISTHSSQGKITHLVLTLSNQDLAA